MTEHPLSVKRLHLKILYTHNTDKRDSKPEIYKYILKNNISWEVK